MINIKYFKINFIWVFLAILITLSVNIGHVFALQTQPPTTTSYYVDVLSTETITDVQNWAYNKGYALGQRDLGLAGTQNSAVILDFGSPGLSGGNYGASGFGRFMTVNDVRLTAVAFAHGYYVGTGSDTSSQLTIIIGTSNSGASVDYNNGRAWSFLVQDIASDLVTNGYSAQVLARGGVDDEPLYSSVTAANNWMSGYISAFTPPYYVYNFGSADSCPTSGSSAIPGACANSWTQDNVRYVSWGATPAMPFPEIYSTGGGNASQWQQISLYSYLAYGAKMTISSPLSQSGACTQKGGCTGTNNTPTASWSQLWNSLNSDTRTAQNLTWSDDISWR